jgi:hypothetical protein
LLNWFRGYAYWFVEWSVGALGGSKVGLMM